MSGTMLSNQPPTSLPSAAGRACDLQAGDLASGAHRAGHLREALPVVGEVAHAEGDGGGIEGVVLDGQVERIALLEGQAFELGPVALVGDLDHARAEVDAQRRAAGLRGPVAGRS